MLAADPGVSITAIAAEAGVDRRTVYRKFASREELLAAIYDARLTDVERVTEEARLREAPVAVALHRYVEGIIGVNRRWPVDLGLMLTHESVRERREHSVRALTDFLRRATDEGLLRSGLPDGWVEAVLPQLMVIASRQLTGLSPAQAADTVVDTLLNGLGAGSGARADAAGGR
ncbi:TetR/AcrR family transcriptional regulator [Streptomyces sp. URMC 126]|uniref:TetR/AcrR family transcriptional regulator n=1 Tax=Streptomyces sp. URMC 126 TaxID=3423401 RepID=UPI003F1B082C